ncbi:MAG: sigma-70 family RNA polymerase sigma factor [Phycisphaerae bacterium]|nr:sigma-70 family RNA polymerase sigma factor [Phycisphaerae bacterium]
MPSAHGAKRPAPNLHRLSCRPGSNGLLRPPVYSCDRLERGLSSLSQGRHAVSTSSRTPDPHPSPAPNVTGLLLRASSGDPAATNELFPLVYDELRRLAAQHMASERAGHTLQATALVHEAYLRLVGPGEVTWVNRAHFFGAAAQAIRRILLDHARGRARVKRGGGNAPTSLDSDGPTLSNPADRVDLIALDDALERLAALDPVKARVVELRYFAGLTLEQTALALQVSVATVSRHWEFARAWLHADMSRGAAP